MIPWLRGEGRLRDESKECLRRRLFPSERNKTDKRGFKYPAGSREDKREVREGAIQKCVVNKPITQGLYPLFPW